MAVQLRLCALAAAVAVAGAVKLPVPLLAPGAKRPTIVVMGRPNVGKSTIVNRMTQRFETGAIVHDESGVTRDRTYAPGWWAAWEFTVVDTGGIVFDDDAAQVFMPQIRQQALTALSEAAVAILVVDGMARRAVRKRSASPEHRFRSCCSARGNWGRSPGVFARSPLATLPVSEPAALTGALRRGARRSTKTSHPADLSWYIPTDPHRSSPILADPGRTWPILTDCAQAGCTPLDEDIADFMRRQNVRCILAVNKCESEKGGELQAADFWQLGLGEPYPVSGMHGTGMGELMDAVRRNSRAMAPNRAAGRHRAVSIEPALARPVGGSDRSPLTGTIKTPTSKPAPSCHRQRNLPV